MERKTFALVTLILGVIVGILGDVLFNGKLIGVSFPLFIGIGIVVVIAVGGVMRQPLRPRNLWVLVPALFFAGMVAVRADDQLNELNVMAALALCALALYYLPLDDYIDLDTIGDHVLGVCESSLSAVFSPLVQLLDSASWLFERVRGDFGMALSVGRGLVIVVPVLLVFAFLFAAADAVFAGYVDRLWSLFQYPDQALFTHGVLIGGIGWLACGTLAYGVGSVRLKRADERRKRKLPALGMIEACMTLGSVDLLFGVFVIIQFAYFFGGHAALADTSLTYAEYARRGFFELVAVSILTLGLVLALDWITVRHARRHVLTFRILAVILVALTGVILVSAWQRMALYEQQFGYSTLRVQTHVFMIWLAVLFGFFLLALFRVRERIFSLGVLIVTIGCLATFNLMNVEGFIAARNIERVDQGYDLDFYYLSGFSADAVPAILDLYQTTRSPVLREAAGQWLTHQLRHLDLLRQTTAATGFSANLARDSAWSALDAIRDTLPEYIPRYPFPGGGYDEYDRYFTD